MTYKEYLEAQDKGRYLMQAIRSALEALDSKNTATSCWEWLINHPVVPCR